MNYISVTYVFTHYFKSLHFYKWTECGKLFNEKTGNRIKKVLNGRCLGYWIGGKFYSITKLKRDNLVVKITEIDKMFRI